MHQKGLGHGDVISLFYIITGKQLFICGNMSANKQTHFSKTRGRLFSLAILALDISTTSSPLFGPAMNRPKV